MEILEDWAESQIDKDIDNIEAEHDATAGYGQLEGPDGYIGY